MHADDMKRLDELKALAGDATKRQKFLMESYEVSRGLGRHFEEMNGSPQLKRVANLMGDWFALQAIGLQQITNESVSSAPSAAPTFALSSQRIDDLMNNLPAELKADIVIQPETIAKALGEPIPPKPTSLAEAVAIARGNPEPPTMPIRFASDDAGPTDPVDAGVSRQGVEHEMAAALQAKRSTSKKPAPEPRDENLF